MVISSGIGGTGIEDQVCFEDVDFFQSELNLWNELLTNFRVGETVLGE